jgi:adenine phosphoribosyltransferase/5'-methylthioadenosine/S-adenosylhomocysteine nucleosidase
MAITGIMGAMQEEIDLYLVELGGCSEKTLSGLTFFSGSLAGKEVVVVKSGVGKVNAGMCAQTLINSFGVSSVIFTGVAGALNPELGIKDIVISRDSMQHDMEAKGLGFEHGQIPFTGLRIFSASPELRKAALAAAQSLSLNVVEGRILTGDQFITDAAKAAFLRKEFGGDCVDMESAAVAHVCALNGIPHVIIRSVSDRADHSAPVDFPEFCKEASKNSFRLVRHMLSLQEATEEPQHGSCSAIKAKIRTVPHWPKQGVMFRDITTLLKDRGGFSHLVRLLADRYKGGGIDVVAAIESRGFITGSVLASRLGTGFVPIRKSGKLPAETLSEEYMLEYGKDSIEVHKDAIEAGSRVLLADDLIATGGTALAACSLIKKLGGRIVECCFIVDLPALGGRKKLEDAGYKTFSLVGFDGE